MDSFKGRFLQGGENILWSDAAVNYEKDCSLASGIKQEFAALEAPLGSTAMDSSCFAVSVCLLFIKTIASTGVVGSSRTKSSAEMTEWRIISQEELRSASEYLVENFIA